ncbi:erythrocyte membrane protein 1, PfEMP1,putative [Plasmodium sp. gorilla clade G3]|nr:erythrocyte membrane protein 1, PfEMP1,putative [Plasmodium sp. gorilla clade G3]
MPSTTSIHDIAKELQTQAEDNAKTRLSVSIIDKLKAHADQGIYTNSGISSLLSSNICIITDSHSNAENTSRNPCKNKDKNNERFSIGKVWAQDDQNVKVGHQGVYLPPRRRGMCTTNLENLDTTNTKGPLLGGTKGNDGKLASNSLLGDVLLAAYKEGENIKNGYSDGKDPSICRAMKYSFADLGDIIRGRDLWSQQSQQKMLQGHLEAVFKNIKDKHPQIKNNDNYPNSDAPKYYNLRDDWWTANRDQVWKAMTCQAPTQADLYVYISGGSMMTFDRKCGHDHQKFIPPDDDYIPQRLRWMTEWSENYCKKLESIYKEVQSACKECKSGTSGGEKKQCTRESSVCTSCSEKCKLYKDHVKKWKEQWKILKQQYDQLYNSSSSGSSSDPIQEKLNEFFQKLKQNGGTNKYKNLSEYIVLSGGDKTCKDAQQSKFDDNDKSSDEYAFSKYPNGYEQACKCKDEPCDVVETILKGQNGSQSIEECHPKDSDGEYPKWECTNPSLVKVDGSCIPPRRQKLCINNLTQLNEQTNRKTVQDFRKSLIKCAAIETFFAWKKYKEYIKNENTSSGGKKPEEEAQKQLDKGAIPDEFKRIMYYTYGDFRDLCLGKDIGEDDGKKISTNIQTILKEERSQNTDQDLDAWWKNVKTDVWKGMLCGLSHHIKDKDEEKQEEARKALTENTKYKYENYDVKKSNPEGVTLELDIFSGTHQFLRWFTEWADEFCREQKKQEAKLKRECSDYTCENDNVMKDACKSACGEYQTFIYGWKKHYTSQRDKFDKDKKTKKYPDEVEEDDDARDYIDKKLQELCKSGIATSSGNCDCMKDASTKSSGSSIPKSLDNYPSDEYVARCGCAEKPEVPRPQAAKPAATKPATTKPVAQQEPCEIVATKLKGRNGEKNIDDCSPKDYKQWECENESFVSGKGECMPPRRQKLCLYYLSHLSDRDNTDKLRKALIECVAVEMFFAWDRYKKNANDANKLKTGDIPENFKRIMFYTYSDYRDICLGKDLGTDENAKGIPGTVTKILGTETPTDWWNTNGSHIWEGMLCGLSHAAGGGNADTIKNANTYDTVKLSGTNGGTTTTKLTEFVKIPQFLRWMTEWSEDFCKKQRVEYEKVKAECNKCSDEKCDNNCEMCKGDCEQYQTFISGWEPEWEKQSGKYETLYQKTKESGTATDQKDQDVVTYLKTLTKSDATTYGTAGGYVKQRADISDCQVSKQNNFDNNGDKYAFADYPKEYKARCTCNEAKPEAEAGGPSPEGTTGQSEAKSQDTPSPGVSGDSAGQGPGQGPGPGQQPPPPPQQQQSAQGGEEAGTASGPGGPGGGDGGGGEDDVDGSKGKGGSDQGDNALEEIARDVFSYPIVAAVIGVQAVKAGSKFLCSSESATGERGATAVPQPGAGVKPGPDGDGHSHGSQEGGADDSGSRGTGSTGNQNPGSPRPSSDGGQDISDSSSSSSSSSSSGSSSDGPSSLPAAEGTPGPNGPAGERGQGVSPQGRQQKSLPELSQILGATLPLTAGIAIASLSYLLLKKKTPTGSTRTFRVIDVSKNKYSIPTTKSTNRYVPHTSDRYKGKTYIYMEQPSSEDSDHYYEDTSDITSSSTESEYEDINDIYPYKSPKYKTLIEVVLEPSKRDIHVTQDTSDTYYTSITQDTSDIVDTHISPDIHSTHMYNIHDMPSDDIPTNKRISDNEWNQLKQDFISNMLQRKQINIPISNISIRHGPIPDVPLSDITSDIPIDTHPYILHHKMDEIPFITQIKDRDLHGGEHITYSINWNIPTNTNMKTSNTMDNPKYVSNNIYTGNDLISDTLNGDLNFDIYSEMLKRKEKELHGGHKAYV